MTTMVAVLLLLAAAVLAVAAGASMVHQAGEPPVESGDPERECGRAVRVLVLAASAVAAGTAGAALVSTGEVSAGGLGPFAFPAALVLTPLVAGVCRGRRGGRGRRGAGVGL
ncbi:MULTISPECIES: hypothetical protein [unclassified Blastococcus]